MNALPRPLPIVVQVVAALVAGIALSVFVGPVLDSPSGAVGSGGIEYTIVPGAYAETGVLGGPASGSGGNVGEVPESNGAAVGGGGSGGVLPGAASESCDSLLCLGGQTGSGGNVGEVPNGQTGSGGSGGIRPGAHASTGLLRGSASGSGGNVGN